MLSDVMDARPGELAEREAFLAQWKAMTPQQRKQWMDAHPAPPHRHGPPDHD